MNAPDHSESSLEKSCRAYLLDLEIRRYSPKSVATYARALQDVALFWSERGKMSARDICKDDLTAYRLSLIDRELRPNSVYVYMRAVRNLFRWLSDRRELFLNPAEGIILRQPPRPLLPVPSEEDMRKLLEAPDTGTPIGIRDRAIMETLYGGGMRRGELSGLKTVDVDIAEATLRVLGKGQRERTVPVGAAAARWIDRYLREARSVILDGRQTDALWVCRFGALSYHAVSQIILVCSDRAGVRRISPHALRRACATHMLAHGASPVEVQLQLGHATLKHLSQYLRVAITDIRKMHGESAPGR